MVMPTVREIERHGRVVHYERSAMLNVQQLDALNHVKLQADAFAAATLGWTQLVESDRGYARQTTLMCERRGELYDVAYVAHQLGLDDAQIGHIIREAAEANTKRLASRLTGWGRKLHATGAYDRAMVQIDDYASKWS